MPTWSESSCRKLLNDLPRGMVLKLWLTIRTEASMIIFPNQETPSRIRHSTKTFAAATRSSPTAWGITGRLRAERRENFEDNGHRYLQFVGELTNCNQPPRDCRGGQARRGRRAVFTEFPTISLGEPS